ncbi:MAG: cytochrome c [Devosia sp.]|uniref:c-type cytochrome n=1 Tax=Devosia sp. TaxID=1871048 RepID=UPI001ACA4851|nr:cytochrome c [Devosia sp.]MBN9308581.1 cytochrome c [Devosia sp.]MBN9317790.1 cytochrome c [Devosia sp.]
MRNIRGAIAVLVLGSAALAGPGMALADPITEGHVLVDEYCSDCHAVGRTGDSPLAIAPRFRELHQRYDIEDLSEALVEGIVTAHPEMPEFEFDPQQAAAIVAYIKSLAGPGQGE